MTLAHLLLWPFLLGAIPPQLSSELVLWAGVLLFSLLLSIAFLTIAYSMVAYFRDHRREAIKDALRPALHARLNREDPGWEQWVISLSSLEREVLLALVEESLTALEGDGREPVLDLAVALDLDRRAWQALESRHKRERVWGLKMLATLRRPVEAERILSTISSDRTEREMAAHLFLVAESCEQTADVLDLLLADGPLTVFGVEVLFRAIREQPTPLLERIEANEIDDDGLLTQVLLVVAQTDASTGKVPLGGVIDCLEHHDPRVRANACLVLAQYGWRTDVREAVDPEVLVRDEAPLVRTAAHRMLRGWGDEEAIKRLEMAVETEGQDSVVVHGIGTGAGSDVHTAGVDPSRKRVGEWAAINEISGELSNPLL